jgi:DNA (cytosine-5)-methyltransferase 1
MSGYKKVRKSPTAVSIFSGCGGFDLGASQAGVDIIWANDINPHSAAAYQSLLPNTEFVLGDIQAISSFPEADILIGCYPCTGFSVAARRKWMDTRLGELRERDLRATEGNFLFWQFIRALSLVRPRFAFVENVTGMVNAADGYFFEYQMYHFRRLGYKAYYKRLNAKDYGVPQYRSRFFVVLVHRELPDFRYEFPQPTHGPGTERPFSTLRAAIGHMDRWPRGDYYEAPFHGHYLTRNRKRLWTEPSFTVVAHAGHVPLHPMGRPMRRRGPDLWELQGRANRRLSWRECAAIQDLPATVAPTGSLRDRHLVVGNAVPPALARVLIRPVVQYENSQ